MNYKIIFGYIAVIISFVGILPYFINIFRNKTKPHAFSWLTWGVAGGIVFLRKYSKMPDQALMRLGWELWYVL